MSESSDYKPSSWSQSHDFSTARDTYKRQADRSYAEAKESKTKQKDLVPATISTQCHQPLILGIDGTGSDKDMAAEVFAKAPYLDHEVKEYLGQDTEISIMVNGDSRALTDDEHEEYPFQATIFVSGENILKKMKELIHEKKGGGNGRESYEFIPLYCLHNVKVPEYAKPLLIFFCDEGIYDRISVSDAKKYAKVDVREEMTIENLFARLKQKYTVYAIRKKYPDNEREINAQWVKLLGKNCVKVLDDPKRVVDVIFGILAEITNRRDYFRQEFEERQKDNPGYFDIVYKALGWPRFEEKSDVRAKLKLHHKGDEGKEAKPLI